MLVPEAQQGLQNTPAIAVYMINAVMVVVGLHLSFKAWRPENRVRLRGLSSKPRLELVVVAGE